MNIYIYIYHKKIVAFDTSPSPRLFSSSSFSLHLCLCVLSSPHTPFFICFSQSPSPLQFSPLHRCLILSPNRPSHHSQTSQMFKTLQNMNVPCFLAGAPTVPRSKRVAVEVRGTLQLLRGTSKHPPSPTSLPPSLPPSDTHLSPSSFNRHRSLILSSIPLFCCDHHFSPDLN
jgi:hypothetical protein